MPHRCHAPGAPFSQFALAALMAAWLATSPPARAEGEISTDRPDVVESSDVVGRGRFQIETSAAIERSRADGQRTRSVSTPTLLRLGVGDTLELRLETDGRLLDRTTDVASGATTSTHGWSDTSLGVKWHARDGDAQTGTAAIAWLLHADLASGSGPYRGEGIRPSLRLVYEWDLPDERSFGVMPGLMSERRADGSRYVSGIFAATVSQAFTDELRGFVELAAPRIARGRDGGTVWQLDLGGAWLVNADLQLDSAFVFGLNRNAPDVGWTVGLSVRF